MMNNTPTFETTISKSTSKIHALIDIFIEPRRALMAIKENSKWFALPLMLSLVTLMAFIYWYYSTVDSAWFTAYQLSLQGELTKEQSTEMAKYLEPAQLKISSLLFGSITVLLIYSLYAIYLNLAAKLSGSEGLNFLDWFSFSVWTAFPSILSTLSMYVAYGLNTSKQIDMNDLVVSSLNSLFFNFTAQHNWFVFFNSLSITTFWSLALSGVGYAWWTNTSISKGMAVASFPYLLVYSVWALIIVL